jgi:hypothetical protein
MDEKQQQPGEADGGGKERRGVVVNRVSIVI